MSNEAFEALLKYSQIQTEYINEMLETITGITARLPISAETKPAMMYLKEQMPKLHNFIDRLSKTSSS